MNGQAELRAFSPLGTVRSSWLGFAGVVSGPYGPNSAMRLDTITPPKPAVFENLRGVVLQDWTDATMAEARSAAVRSLARKYTIKYEGDTK